MNAHHGERENGYLAENSLQIDRVAFYGRYENVNKSAEELGINFVGQVSDDVTYVINNLTLGTICLVLSL